MLTDWMLRLRSLFRRDAVERDLDDELRFHVEKLVESYTARGLSRDEAFRRARIDMGTIDQIKEEHRDARGIGVFDGLSRDLRLAWRQIVHAPGFAALAVLCLGLGIGVNTSIFAVVNAVLLRPMPVEAGNQLVWIGRDENTPWSYPAYREVRGRTRTLAQLAVSAPMESDLEVQGESSFVTAEMVTDNYVEALGLEPVLGRWIADNREAAVVISYAVWKRYFDLSPDVIGRIVRSGSESYTIVGVAPREYVGVFAPIRTDIWVPIESRPRVAAQLEQGGVRNTLKLLGRLQEGVTVAQASAELNAIDAQLPPEQAQAAGVRTPIVIEKVRAIPDPGLHKRAAMLSTLLAVVVGLVLLIACVNVGNLLLVRGALRQREFAVRRALGASRSRLLQQLLTESLILAAAGAVLGVILAVWANGLLGRSVPPFLGSFALELNTGLDWRSVVFAGIVAFVATILCGLLPAWRTSRAGSLVEFKGEIGSGIPRRRPIGLVAQVVMSLVLLFLAGSFLQALQHIYATDPGFDTRGRLYAYASVASPPFTPESRRAFYAQALERLRALPAVRSASLTSTLPLMPSASGCVSQPGGAKIPATTSAVEIRYFDTMGIDLVAGRDFTIGDASSSAEAVILNESLARRIFPNGGAAGERITVGCDTRTNAVVVGVVKDSAITGLDDPASQSHVFRAIARQDSGGLTAIVVNTAADPASLVEPVRRTLLAQGQGIRVYTVQPFSTYLEQRYAPFRWLSKMLTGLGALALLLAGVGLYGVIAYRVALRTQEIGLRMALGASRADVFREVLTSGLTIVLAGVAIGEILTVGLTRLAGSVQERVGANAIEVHVAVALIWIAVSLCACYLPAARAARVDPLTALRHE
jgi:putative ABC transport system permease protein